MRLKLHTDYALRVLMYLGANAGRTASIAEIARVYAISENHLMKVVNSLARAGLVAAKRGRGGGLQLGRRPEEINIGGVVRLFEGRLEMADCALCRIVPACRLTRVLGRATEAFLAVLDEETLADLLGDAHDLRRALDLETVDA